MGRLREGFERVRTSWLYIVQLGLAAGLSYWIGVHLIGHPQPFFAPMATIIVLSATGGDRMRRAFELVLGVGIGVGLGDLLINYFGAGVWQIAVGVVISVTAVMFVDKGVLAANQAAFASVLIATILPPGTSGGMDRMVDAFIGGVVGIVVMALLPQSPLKGGRREIARILGLTSAVLADVADAMDHGDSKQLAAALQKARGTQGAINNMINTANSSREVVNASPLMWKRRRELRSILRVLNPVDNAMRNTRVLARRAVVLLDDQEPLSQGQMELIHELAEISHDLSEVFWYRTDASMAPELPQLANRLRKLAAQAAPDLADPDAFSTLMILGQTRSLIVDLLQVCGLSRRSAVAALVPTSSHPGFPPEVIEDL
ncbi:FUSC family protein [Corynebacterium sp. H128]|uniref:FUSC family protein n=1 Tax=unclassified Corynebacterium TaxID=2624378 RepID=UPI0030B5E14B